VNLCLLIFLVGVAVAAYFAWQTLFVQDVRKLEEVVERDCKATADALLDANARLASFTQSTQAMWRGVFAVNSDLPLASFLAFLKRTTPALHIPADISSYAQNALAALHPIATTTFHRVVLARDRDAWERRMSDSRNATIRGMTTMNSVLPVNKDPNYRHIVHEMTNSVSAAEAIAIFNGVDISTGTRSLGLVVNKAIRNISQSHASALHSVGFPPVNQSSVSASFYGRTTAGVIEFVARDESNPFVVN
jgi:hypothetical protein